MTAQIEPFRIETPQAGLDDPDRLARTRWWTSCRASDGAEACRSTTSGTRLSTGERASTGEQEAMLNELPSTRPQSTASGSIFHVRSPEPNALPLVLTHGYPSSVVEFVDVIGPPTDPRAHGGNPADALHAVAPSLPGFGFSSPLRETGWESTRTAKAWVELMRRLGYQRYVAHGTDIGAGVSGDLAIHNPDGVLGAHVATDPSALALIGGMLLEESEEMTESQRRRLTELRAGGGRPGIPPDPVHAAAHARIRAERFTPSAQLAWIVEKFASGPTPPPSSPKTPSIVTTC